MEELETRLYTVKDFFDIGLTLIIPDYQRGYRWTETQIEKLLDDLYDFGVEKKYSLQPITLKKDDNAYKVIDGQQRLTTICLILDEYNNNEHPLQDKIKPKGKDSWEGLDKKFIDNAKAIIENWEKSDKKKREKVVKTLNSAEILIYLLQAENDTDETKEIEFFSKINSGKIALTNSEIIKALFVKILSCDEQAKKRLLKQWEDIENDLQNDNFWLFISNDKKKTDTRIDFLFRLLKETKEDIKNIPETKNSQYSLFLVYEDYLKLKSKENKQKAETVKNIWQEIRRYYSILKYLQNDTECYHLFGYLMSVDEEKAKECLKDLYESSKTIVIETIKSKIKEHLENVLVIKNKNERVCLQIDQLNYNDHKDKIRDILLLFNAQTATTMEGFRFPFDTYKRINYQVEHIHARNTKLPIESNSYMQKWLICIKDNTNNYLNDWLSNIKDNSTKDIEEQIKNAINGTINGNNLTDESLRLFAMYTYLKEWLENNDQKNAQNGTNPLQNLKYTDQKVNSQDEIDKILNEYNDSDDNFGNLTLLNAEINQSYGNDYFLQKQQKIKEEDLNGTFILPCTKRIFYEHYTKCDKIWNEENKNEYIEHIKNCLKDFLPKEQKNGNGN